MFKTTFTSIAPSGRAKEHAALVAAHVKDERDVEAQALQLRRDIERDDERCAQLRASLDEVGAHRYRVQRELSQLLQAHDRRRGDRERTLSEYADPRIDTFLDWITQQQAGLTHQLRLVDFRGGIDARSGKALPTTSGYGNWDAVQHVSTALSRAREQAEALKYQTVSDVGVALEEIRRSVPTVDRAEEMLRAAKDVA